MTQHSDRPFRWAIFGTGAVARKFVLDLRQLDGHVAHVVASRQGQNAERFAADLGVAAGAAEYADAAQADVDAIYIATPPALHEAHAMLGIQAGRAVLIEKPFALDVPSAERIAAAAEAAGVFCMEAMWTRFQPLPALIKAHLDQGALGDLCGFEGRFMFANKTDPKSGLFDPDQGGGALMHRGVYPISLAHFFLGPVSETRALGVTMQTGVDQDSAVLLRHANGALSSLRASTRATGPEGAMIYGTKGTILLQGPIWRPTGAVLTPTHAADPTKGGARRFEAFRESGLGLRVSGSVSALRGLMGRQRKRLSAPFAGNGYHYQAQAVQQAVAEGKTQAPHMRLSDSIEVIQILDQARQSWSARGTP